MRRVVLELLVNITYARLSMNEAYVCQQAKQQVAAFVLVRG